MRKSLTRLMFAGLALALLPLGCRADTPSYDDASAEEIFAAAEEAMADVGSFVSVHEWTLGDETTTIETELQDGQNYRRILTVSDEGDPHPRLGPSEVAVVDGQRFAPGPYQGSGSPPAYRLPHDLFDLERLDDATLDGTRVYHLRGTRLPNDEVTDEVPSGITTFRTSHWTFDLFIDATTLLLVRSEGMVEVSITTARGDDPVEERIYNGLSTTTYGRFNEDFDIVPPPPTPTPTPLPTATPTPTPR